MGQSEMISYQPKRSIRDALWYQSEIDMFYGLPRDSCHLGNVGCHFARNISIMSLIYSTQRPGISTLITCSDVRGS